MNMIVYIYYSQAVSGFGQSFLCFQQYSETRTRNIFEPGEIDRFSFINGIQEFLRFLALCGIESPRTHDFPVISISDFKHLYLQIPW